MQAERITAALSVLKAIITVTKIQVLGKFCKDLFVLL